MRQIGEIRNKLLFVGIQVGINTSCEKSFHSKCAKSDGRTVISPFVILSKNSVQSGKPMSDDTSKHKPRNTTMGPEKTHDIIDNLFCMDRTIFC